MRHINLCISGGRTSAYMGERVLYLQSKGYWSDIEFILTFANTGREHPMTLDFVNNCDLRWQKLYGVGVVWLECVVHQGKLPSSHRITNYIDASRKGEPFEAVVAKYGLPNNNFLHCTREMKENPIMSYMESLGEVKGHEENYKLVSATYETWIGIRSDEPKRLKGNRDGKQLKGYPLADIIQYYFIDVDITCDKTDVLDYWEDMPFDLNLPEWKGNCIDCHKKNEKKLFMVARDMGENSFDFTKMLDDKYSYVKPQILEDGSAKYRKRFRGYKNTTELIASFRVSDYNPRDYSDESGGCSESCEPFMGGNEVDPSFI
tara:strand:- start:2451 stop:3404 length:954 start_codon:yes stop_codon:yes gene_type:complete